MDISNSASGSDAEVYEYDDHRALELRLKVDRAFGISRATGMEWFEAVRFGDAGAVKRLLREAGARDAARPKPLASEHPQQARPGTLESSMVERLVNYNGQATSYGFVGSTALHWACANGDQTIAEMLLAAGASVNAQNFGGSTALHSACANGQPEMVALLLRFGANPSIVDCCGDRPLDVASPDLPASERRRVAALLTMHGTIEKMLQGVGGATGLENLAPNAAQVPWSAAQMRSLLVAVGAVTSEAQAPPDASELRAASVTALSAVAIVKQRSELADQKAAALQARVERRLDAQRKKVAACRAESSDSDSPPGAVAAAPRRPPRDVQAAVEAEIAAAEDAKAKGNAAYQGGDFKAAIKWYTTALSITGGAATSDATFYSNRSAAYCQLGQYTKALDDGRRAVALKPDWAKGHHRVGTAAYALGQHHDAAAAFRAGLSLVPEDPTLRMGLRDAETALVAAGGEPPRPASTTAPSPGAVARSPPANLSQFAPGERKPWFECAICDNRTRDHAASPCCGLLVCGTCAKRRFGGPCPFACTASS
jgi:tetratricopeptide (TPR) repeat protein